MHALIDHLSPARQALLAQALPAGVPALWCPVLTPFRPDGGIDGERLARHLDRLHGSVGGLLAPGSTGDGWTLSDTEVQALLDLLLPLARARGMAVLVGVLKPDSAGVLQQMRQLLDGWRASTGLADDPAAMRAVGVCGFTVCAPAGAGLPQAAIFDALDTVLATGLPIALYQLPQVTGNEIDPPTVQALADRHPNFLWFKDTSGTDRVSAAGVRDVVLVRGAEGDYHRHLRSHGGAYDGFLLSTANVFGPELARLIDDLRQGRTAEAEALSARLQAVVTPVFAAAAGLPHGNAFTHANKAIDHWMAHGPDALNVPGPRLHAGPTLPPALIALAGHALRTQGLLPAKAYLA